MNRSSLLFLLLSLGHFSGMAQTVSDECRVDSMGKASETVVLDSLSVPLTLPAPRPMFMMSAPGFDGCALRDWGMYGPAWDLHSGFNAQLGMSVTAGFGKHAPSGVGFGQSAAFAYALPLGKRFSLACGLYAQNMDWGRFHQKDVGLAAVLGYRLNDVVSLYAYGAKSLMPKSAFEPIGCFPLYMDQVRDRIGAMAEFKIGENAKIQVSVERTTAPSYYVPMWGAESYATPVR